MKWQIGTVGQFYECGEDRVVYYDPASGDTHLVSDFACYLVRTLANAPRALETEEVIEIATADIEPEDLHELSLAIPGILDELAQLEIIWTA